MGGFFRKVAGAFVYLDEGAERPERPASDSQLDQIALESSELISQLSPTRMTAASPFGAPAARGSDVNAGSTPSGSIMDMSADQVFAASALVDSPNSAQRILKLIAGLSTFPKEQQIVMVRAMDAADDGWSEKDVLEDARQRQAVLRNHIQAIEAEKQDRLQRVAANSEAAQAESRRLLEEIDGELAALQQRREQTVSRTTAEVSELEHQRRSVEESAERARRGITGVINAFSELITFFIGGASKPDAKS